MSTYKIIRKYALHPEKAHTIRTRQNLEAAQAHCQDPEASSSTAQSLEARRRTEKWGPWFDVYTKEK